MSIRDRDALKIGDCISLKSILHQACLCGEGIISKNVYVQDNLEYFDDCIFRVQLQRQYSASLELASYMSTISHSSHTEKESPDALKYIAALERGRDNETMLNESYMRKKTGNAVVFGDTVQLLHVKSGKFLTVVQSQVSPDERENLKLTLDTDGDNYSWLQLLPRYKIDRKGDNIQSGTEIYIKAVDRKNEFIHAADRMLPSSRYREVNCSLETSSWKLNIFESSTESCDKEILLANELVYISDPETLSTIALRRRNIGCIGDLSGTANADSEDSIDVAPLDMTVVTARSIEVPGGQVTEATEEDIDPCYSDVIVVPRKQFLDSNSLWSIESKTLVNGGPILWKTQEVRFRHLNTGVYLCISPRGGTDLWGMKADIETEAPARSNSALALHQRSVANSEFVLSTTRRRSDPSTLFSIDEMYFNRNELSNSRALQMNNNYISHSPVWVQRGDLIHDDDNESINYFTALGSFEREDAVSLIINRYIECEEQGKGAVNVLVASGGESAVDDGGEEDKQLVSSVPLDVHSCVSFRNYFQLLLSITVIPTSSKAISVWPKLQRTDTDFFLVVIQRVICYSQGFPIYIAEEMDFAVEKADPTVKAMHQRLLREQGVIEVILHIIHKLTPISAAMEEMAHNSVKESDIPETLAMLHNFAQVVLKQCFSVIFYCVQENPDNQMFVADFLPVLLAHLCAQPYAGKCVTEMLSSNMELQETKIGRREIGIFVNQLRLSKFNGMYLRLLQSCCSCQGNGVDGNQCKVTEKLFSNTKDTIITLFEDLDKGCSLDWTSGADANNKFLFIPEVAMHSSDAFRQAVEADTIHLDVDATKLALSQIKGGNLISKGVPKVFVLWASSLDESSPGQIFHKDKVSLEEMFAIPRDNKNTVAKVDLTSKVNAFSTVRKTANSVTNNRIIEKQLKKSNMADYFTSQLYLMAEMCMDRNYVAMLKLDEFFSYETLVAVLKLTVNDTLKAAVVRLLVCLHVDRDPQATTIVPRLSRTWTSIKDAIVPKLPSVPLNRILTFALLQQIVGEHIRSMCGTHWTPLSYQMLQLLHALIKFNFYGSIEKLNDIIIPLISALDRRAVEVDVTQLVIAPTRRRRQNTVVDTSRADGLAQIATARLASQNNQSHSAIQEEDEDESVSELDNSNLRGTQMKKQGSIFSLGSLVSENSQTADQQKSILFGMADPEGVEYIPLYKRILDIMESVTALIFVLFIVVVAATQVILVSLITVKDTPGSPVYFFEIAVVIFFGLEFSIRSTCYYLVHREMYSFIDIYNIIDILVIVIDVIFMSLPASFMNGLSFARVLRLARLFRLLRLARAVKVVSKLKGQAAENDSWTLPIRYSSVPLHELQSMVEAAKILEQAQNMIADRNVSLFLRYFYLWEDGQDKRSPGELFLKVIDEYKALSLETTDSNDILLDLMMFEHPSLVQYVLSVFMTHHSPMRILMENVKYCQLLVSPKRERQYLHIETMLAQLEQNAETHELWGELQSEEDKKINKQTFEILDALIGYLRLKRFVLEFNETYMPDMVLQDTLRNLGCFDICFKVIGLVESIEEEEDGSLAEPFMVNTQSLLRKVNELLFWFLYDNHKNQLLGYTKMEFFIETLCSNINSHDVIRAIFSNNDQVMKQCPHATMHLMTDKICKLGQLPQFLSLLAAVTHVGDRNIVENQYEVVKSLTNPQVLPDICCFFSSIHNDEYEEKVELMKPHLIKKDISMNDVSPKLAYHLALLDVFCGCTVGKANITTVEAKVQSVFYYADIVQALLDSRSILLLKVKLAQFFYHSTIDVEMRIPGLEYSYGVWELLYTFIPIFAKARDEIRAIEKVGWEAPHVSRHNMEYMLACVRLAEGFFRKYYHHQSFHVDEVSMGPEHANTPHLTVLKINDLIFNLYLAIKDIYVMDSPRFSHTQKQWMFDAMHTLNKSASKILVTVIDNIHDVVQMDEYGNAVPRSTGNESGAAPIDTATLEGFVIDKYGTFLKALECDKQIQSKLDHESSVFIAMIENLPRIGDISSDADVRFEPFIIKLITHAKSNLKLNRGEKYMTESCMKTTLWTIKVFRTMIEKAWGMDINERDGEGGEEQDEAAAEIVDIFDKCGVTHLCLDLIALGVDPELQAEAMKLCVAMLFKEGGAVAIQQSMFTYLSKSNSILFFKQLRQTIAELMDWHLWNGVIHLGEDQEPSPPDDIIAIRFMQLMCEGHFEENQNIMRSQLQYGVNTETINLLDDLVLYLSCLSKIVCRTSTSVAIRVASTILEVIQGPCEGNQEYFALNTEIVETLNRLMRATVMNDCDEGDEIELKKIAIDIFQGLLEGQASKTAVYERVLSVLHLDILYMMTQGENMEETQPASTDPLDEPKEEEPLIAPKPSGDLSLFAEPSRNELEAKSLMIECGVLFQMLCAYKPSIRDVLGITEKEHKLKKTAEETGLALPEVEEDGATSCIEIIWRGEIQRRFFHVPQLCCYLSKSSRATFVEEADRTSPENKLLSLLSRSKVLFREIKHQEWLTKIGVSGIFSVQNQNRATWAAFSFACLINLLFLSFYKSIDGAAPSYDKEVSIAILIFNVLQIFLASFTLLLFLVVRSPVIYQGYESEGLHFLYCFYYTMLDPMTLYYLMYLLFAVLGAVHADYWLPWLLLDIVVKNSTTRDVLYAVYYPRVQLGMTVLLGLFVFYIFAFFAFQNYRYDFFDQEDCMTMWNCIKIFFKGMATNGGVADFMEVTLGPRFVSDVLYYVVIIVVLMNIVFGIIIDTFGALRAAKDDRQRDTISKCFVCGIDDIHFDRLETDGFKTHIEMDHNLWNYFNYIVFIWEQDKDEDDGLEYFVRQCIESEDISWFPMNKALRLSKLNSSEDVLKSELRSQLKQTEADLAENFSLVESETQELLDVIKVLLMEISEEKASVTSHTHKARKAMQRSQSNEQGSVSGSVSFAGGGLFASRDFDDGDSSVVMSQHSSYVAPPLSMSNAFGTPFRTISSHNPTSVVYDKKGVEDLYIEVKTMTVNFAPPPDASPYIYTCKIVCPSEHFYQFMSKPTNSQQVTFNHGTEESDKGSFESDCCVVKKAQFEQHGVLHCRIDIWRSLEDGSDSVLLTEVKLTLAELFSISAAGPPGGVMLNKFFSVRDEKPSILRIFVYWVECGGMFGSPILPRSLSVHSVTEEDGILVDA